MAITMSKIVYDLIEHTVGLKEAETGGIALAKNGTEHVSDFIFMEPTEHSRTGYLPNIRALRDHAEIWKERGMFHLAQVHSHPDGNGTMSQGDITFALEIMKRTGLKRFYHFIVHSHMDFVNYKLHTFLIDQTSGQTKLTRENLVIR